jgi:hypothetical protein
MGRRKRPHGFPYEKHSDGLVIFYDPGLPFPMPQQVWEARSPGYQIDSIVAAEKLEILLKRRKRPRERKLLKK